LLIFLWDNIFRG